LDRVEIIQRAAADTQLNLYFLKERFFNIWYLMRVAPKGSQNKVIWLVRFLESWYDKDELIHRAKRHIDALCKGDYHPKGAYYLTEALAWTGKLDMDVEHELITQTKKFLEGKDESLLADLSPSDKEIVEKSYEYFEKGEYREALNILSKVKYQEEIYTLLALLYSKLNDYVNSEKYCLIVIEKGNDRGLGMNRAMNILSWGYFERKIRKQEALQYAYQSVERGNYILNIHTLACIYVWDNQHEKAFQIDKEFMYNKRWYDKFKDDIILYLMLLLAKEQYRYVTQYFEDPELNLKERFKPLYYALLHFTDNKDFHKMPPELAEPVKDIIEKVKQMAVDYA